MRKLRRLDIVVVLVCLIVAGALIYAYVRSRPREIFDPPPPCQSNLKQLGFALAMYAQDFGDTYPWRVGARKARDAWADLGLLFPEYAGGWRTLFCPASTDKWWTRTEHFRARQERAAEPFDAVNPKEVISYSYSHEVRSGAAIPWTAAAAPSTRLLADKKAGLPVEAGGANPPSKVAAHYKKLFPWRRRYGRYVVCLDLHVELVVGRNALDADPATPTAGERDHAAWWSDPPFSKDE
jgi:hypothetical protein